MGLKKPSRKLLLAAAAPGVLALAAVPSAMLMLPPASAAPTDPGKIPVNTAPAGSDQALVTSSDLIVRGRLDESSSSYPTGRSEGTRKVLHYVQQLRVEETWKGAAPQSVISLLTSGVEPLPDASDPLNKTYTGPLAGGEYVCFLKKTQPAGYYTLTGLWQGLYPLYGGKSVALLANGGFPSFDQLSIRTFKSKVIKMAASP
jgi:hypothetical protein